MNNATYMASGMDGELKSWSAARSRGSRHFRPESWVPTSKDPLQFFVEHLGPCLEQETCSTEGPLHLLFLDEPSADHLIDRRLDECRADPFALSPSLAKVRDELAVVLDVYLELGHPRLYVALLLYSRARCPE